MFLLPEDSSLENEASTASSLKRRKLSQSRMQTVLVEVSRREEFQNLDLYVLKKMSSMEPGKITRWLRGVDARP